MPTFKDSLNLDIQNTFFNQDEFAEKVTIDGKTQEVVIDDERLQERSEKEFDGITTGRILYFIPVASFASKPKVGEPQQFNNRLYWVETVDEATGVYEIVINQNRSD